MSDYFTSASSTPFGAALQRVETLSENLDNINGLTDVLISQNVWLIKRVRELEDRLYKLESGAASSSNAGIMRQGGHCGHGQHHQQMYNSLFSPSAAQSSYANHPTLMTNNLSDGRQHQQQVPQPIPPLLTSSFNFLTLGQQRGNMVDPTTIEQH